MSYVKQFTKLWYGDKIKNTVSGREGIVKKFEKYADGMHIVLEGDNAALEDAHVDNWTLLERSEATKLKEVSVPKYKFLENFHIKNYDKEVRVAEQTNKELGLPGAISVSKTARVNDKILEERGSVWHNCTTEQLQTYHKIERKERMFENIMTLESAYCLKRITKSEIIALPLGEKYSMMYVPNESGTPQIIDCIKIQSDKPTDLAWNEANDKDMDYCVQSWEDIQENGKFITAYSREREVGYLYIVKSNVEEATMLAEQATRAEFKNLEDMLVMDKAIGETKYTEEAQKVFDKHYDNFYRQLANKDSLF